MNIGVGATLAVIFAATVLVNVYLFHYSHGLYSSDRGDVQSLLEQYIVNDLTSTAQLTKAWLLKAGREHLSLRQRLGATASPVGMALSAEGLADAFDPHGLINAWDIYPPDVSCPDMERVGHVGDGK